MYRFQRSLHGRGQRGWALGTLIVMLGFSAGARAQKHADLAVIKPTESCAELAKTDLSHVADAMAILL